jgi:hypothetical protein
MQQIGALKVDKMNMINSFIKINKKQPAAAPLYWIPLLFLTMLLLNCSAEKAETTIPDDQFIDILARMMVIEQLKLGSKEKAVLTNEVFKNFNVTDEAFRAYKEKNKKDIQHWIIIYKETEKRIKSITSKEMLLGVGEQTKRDINADRHKK